MFKFYVYLVPLALLPACQKASLEFSLTPATQQGANTLSCLVDDRVYQAYGRRCTDFGNTCEERLEVKYHAKKGRLTINSVLSTTERDERLALTCDSVFTLGVVAGNQQPFSYRLAGLGYTDHKLNYSTADPTRTRITITRLDTVNHIIAGTFEGYLKGLLINPTTEKRAVSVTEGRFDVVYSQ